MNTPVNAAESDKPIDYTLLLLRAISLVLLVFSISYWASLVGYSDETIRFDTLSNPWKIAATSLVVLQPVAALGLWGGWRWGVVIWILVALIEGAMYGVYYDIFGAAFYLLLFHAIGLVLYFAFLIIFTKAKTSAVELD
ncbi:MAG: DUF6163 family protein [Pseudomonadota bacterium]